MVSEELKLIIDELNIQACDSYVWDSGGFALEEMQQ
jgi:hypothetical protein